MELVGRFELMMFMKVLSFQVWNMGFIMMKREKVMGPEKERDCVIFM